MTNFWQEKKLSELSPQEWESLCDGCGKCCLHKLEDQDTGEVAFTWLACSYLDLNTCKCSDYKNRFTNVLSCLKITYDNMDYIKDSLPQTCAYKRLYEGDDLPSWHPLITGNPQSVHIAGISVKEKAMTENDMALDNIEDFIIEDDNF